MEKEKDGNCILNEANWGFFLVINSACLLFVGEKFMSTLTFTIFALNGEKKITSRT